MSKKAVYGRINLKLALLSGLVLAILLAFFGLRYRDTGPELESVVSGLTKKNEAISRMRINLIKSADVEKAAVMADTDELSRSLADQSLQAAEAVEADRLELTELIEHDPTENERNLLREFNTCWEQSRKIDKVLLDFAVENTNIKAAGLSFTQGSKSLERFEKNLIDLVDDNASNSRKFQIMNALATALVAGFKIQYQQAPHIAAANDGEMDRIEKEMRVSQEIVEDSLTRLGHIVPAEARATLLDAVSAFDEFKAVNAQVITLSRQNSNVKSFELSLGRKRKLTTQCDEVLTSLQAAVRNRTFEATK